MALSAHALIRGWDVTPHGLSLWGGRAGERGRGWDQERWLQGWVMEGGCKPCCWGTGCCTAASLPCLQHPDQILEAGFTSPHAPLWFVLPCVLILLVFPSRAAALLLTLSLPALGLTDAGLPWSCLSPGPSQALLLRPGTPFPGIASAAHLHPPYFFFKHFNVMGQQLRGCPDPFLEALSTF